MLRHYTKDAYKKARDASKKAVETPMEWSICGKVQYKCLRQIGMDGKTCSVQVDDEKKMNRLAKKAKLPIAQTSKCVKMDLHGRRHLGEEAVGAGGAGAGAPRDVNGLLGVGGDAGGGGGDAGDMSPVMSPAARAKAMFLGRLKRWAGHSIIGHGVRDAVMQSPGLAQPREEIVGGEDGAADGAASGAAGDGRAVQARP